VVGKIREYAGKGTGLLQVTHDGQPFLLLFGEDIADSMMEFCQNIYSDRPLAISRDVCSESLVSEFDQGLVYEYTVPFIQKHLL